MLRPRPMRFLYLSVGLAIAFSSAVARAADSRLLSSCTHCWPLSGAHPHSLMAPDGVGGTYVVWLDGSPRWRLQRLGADLTIPKLWPAAGLVLNTGREANRIYPVLAADGVGGVYVAWAEQATNGDMTAWLLRVRADGRPARGWPEGGVVLAPPSPMVMYPALARSGSGAAVAWFEGRNGAASIRLAARDANGRSLARWPEDGMMLPACESCTIPEAIQLASDGRGGLFVARAEMGARLSDLKMSHVSERAATARNWTLASAAVPPHAIQPDSHPELVADGLGGAIMVWADERSQDGATPRDLTDAFGQRMTPAGQDLWTPEAQGHHPIAAGPGYQMNPHVVSDGNGGGFFSWNEHGPFATASGRVQHLDSQGRVVPGWPAGGLALGLEVANLISDLEGGAYAVWTDSSGAHLQRFASGWTPGRDALAPFDLGPAAGRWNVRIAPDRRGGAFMAWEERGEIPAPSSGGGPDDVALRHRLQIKVLIQHLSFQSGAVSPIVQLPTDDTPAIAFALHPVAPNPAHGSCRIIFDLPNPERVTIDVFDVAGRRVARLADRHLFEAGPQSVSWDLGAGRGRRVPAGLYLVRVAAGKNQAVVRVAVTG